MRTLKLSMAIATVALSSVICQAQPGGEHSGRHNNGVNHKDDGHPQKHDKGARLAEKLGLTPKQANRLKAIHDKQRTENKAIQEKMAPLKNELKVLKEKKKALNEINRKEIESLLTPGQFIKLQELKQNQKENRKDGRKERR
tara:strand:- start:2722 stop:3147 length:426 start_codon:yes stop_codon:yes gene_type:complete